MRINKSVVGILILIALTASSLGCLFSFQSEAVTTEIPNSTESVVSIETQVNAAIETVQNGGKIFLELTEDQLTSVAADELSKQGNSDIRNLRISLDDGLMKISGDVDQNGIELPLTLFLKINVDQNGQPFTEIISGKVGIFSLPDNLLAQITSQFDLILQAQLAASAGSLFVESVGIDNGKLTVVARPQ